LELRSDENKEVNNPYNQTNRNITNFVCRASTGKEVAREESTKLQKSYTTKSGTQVLKQLVKKMQLISNAFTFITIQARYASMSRLSEKHHMYHMESGNSSGSRKLSIVIMWLQLAI